MAKVTPLTDAPDTPPTGWPRMASSAVSLASTTQAAALDVLDPITAAPSLVSANARMDALEAKINELIQRLEEADILPNS